MSIMIMFADVFGLVFYMYAFNRQYKNLRRFVNGYRGMRRGILIFIANISFLIAFNTVKDASTVIPSIPVSWTEWEAIGTLLSRMALLVCAFISYLIHTQDNFAIFTSSFWIEMFENLFQCDDLDH